MKPINFPEVNHKYAEHQEQYETLPGYRPDKHPKIIDNTGTFVHCQFLTFWERIRLLFSGRVWIATLTFGNPFQPIYCTTKKDEVIDQEAMIKNGRSPKKFFRDLNPQRFIKKLF